MNKELFENIEFIKKEFRVHGYYSILLDKDFDEKDVNELRPYLMEEFNNLLYVEVNQDKKYFIVNRNGKATVLRLLDSIIYNNKRALVNRFSEEFDLNYRHLNDLRTLIEKTRFDR